MHLGTSCRGMGYPWFQGEGKATPRRRSESPMGRQRKTIHFHFPVATRPTRPIALVRSLIPESALAHMEDLVTAK